MMAWFHLQHSGGGKEGGGGRGGGREGGSLALSLFSEALLR